MNSEINDQETEETPWRWSDKIEEIREAIIARTPEHLDRYDGLVWLRARLMDYEEAIEATILGYDPDDPRPRGGIRRYHLDGYYRSHGDSIHSSCGCPSVVEECS